MRKGTPPPYPSDEIHPGAGGLPSKVYYGAGNAFCSFFSSTSTSILLFYPVALTSQSSLQEPIAQPVCLLYGTH